MKRIIMLKYTCHIICRVQYTYSKDKCSIGFKKLHKHIETEMVPKLILKDNNVLFYFNIGI